MGESNVENVQAESIPIVIARTDECMGEGGFLLADKAIVIIDPIMHDKVYEGLKRSAEAVGLVADDTMEGLERDVKRRDDREENDNSKSFGGESGEAVGGDEKEGGIREDEV
jgi:hypothetical protein